MRAAEAVASAMPQRVFHPASLRMPAVEVRAEIVTCSIESERRWNVSGMASQMAVAPGFLFVDESVRIRHAPRATSGGFAA